MAALVAVNFAIVGARLTDGSDGDADPNVVVVEEVSDDTVLIVAPDGSTISVDPSTTEGKKAIADAEARGDTIVTTPPDGSRSAASDPSSPAAAGQQSTDELDAADGVVDGLVQVVDERTGEIVQVATDQVDQDGDGNVDLPDTSDADAPLLSVTTPGVTVTTPEVTVTTPGVTVTTPPVSVTTPPVTVSTPVTTVTVPTTTVTVPTTTVTVPTTTVTVPTTTVTVPTTTVTVPPATVTVTTLDLGL